MKKQLLTGALLMGTLVATAQVGVGTLNPNQSSQLDVVSSAKGIMIPRVALNGILDTTTITNGNVESLLIYNTTENDTITKGFYYWYDGEWRKLLVHSDLTPDVLTTLSYDNSNSTLTYKDEEGVFHNFVLNNTQNTTIVLNGTVLELTDTDGNTINVDLAGLDTNTTNATLVLDDENQLHLTDSDGNVISANLNSLAIDENTTITSFIFNQTTNTLELTNSEGDVIYVDLSTLLDDTDTTITDFDFNEENFELSITDSNNVTKTVDLSALFNSTLVTAGDNITITGDGSPTNPYVVNVGIASTSNLGVVKIGSGINVDANGVISVPAAPGETTTTLVQSINGLVYTNEGLQESTAKIVSADAENLITAGTDFGAKLTKENVQDSQIKYEVIDGLNTTATLDPTSTEDLKKYKIDVEFPAIAPTTNELSSSQNTMTSVVDGVSSNASIVNSVELSLTGTNLTSTVNGVSNTTPLDLSSIDTNTDEQTLTFTSSTNTLSIERGNSVDLSSLAVDTNNINETMTLNDQNVLTLTDSEGVEVEVNLSSLAVDTNNINETMILNDQNVLTLTDSEGVEVEVNLSSLAVDTNNINETMTLNDQNVLTLTDSEGVEVEVNLSSLAVDTNNINETMTLNDQNVLTLTDSEGVEVEVDLSSLAVDTNTTNKSLAIEGANLVLTDSDDQTVSVPTADLDKQQLSLSDNTLTLERGGSVDLAKYDTKLSNGTNTTVTGAGTTADPYQVNVANTTNSLTTTGNSLTSTVDGVSASVTDLVKTVDLTLNGTILSSTVNGVADASPVDLSSINTDNQNLAFNTETNVLSIDRGNTVDLSSLATDTNTKYVVAPAASNVVVTPTNDAATDTTTFTIDVKKARPDFFYYPSILIPLQGTLDNDERLTLDLYGIYSQRWTTPAVTSTGAEETSLSSILIPSNLIDIYVTYYDQDVLENVTIDEAGTMKYKVKANYNLTDASYMNIVFKVRNTPKQ